MLADLDGRVPAEHAETYAALRGLLDRGDDCRGLPEAFIHPDPAHVNVITAGAGMVLVDWTEKLPRRPARLAGCPAAVRRAEVCGRSMLVTVVPQQIPLRNTAGSTMLRAAAWLATLQCCSQSCPRG